MEIIINNQQAVLKEGTSFDFIAENRLFTGSDSYTLTITFPLRGCAQNIAIFGHIHRADVAKNKVVFDCEFRDRVILQAAWRLQGIAWTICAHTLIISGSRCPG